MPPLLTPNPTPSKDPNSQTQSSTPASRPSQSTQASRNPKKTADLSPEHHVIMLRHALSSPTIRALTSLPRGPPPEEILRCAASATEFLSFTFNPLEKVAFSHINNDPSTRWPLKENLAKPWHKVFLVAQCEASGGDYGDRLSLQARHKLLLDKAHIVKILGQILRACADIMGCRKDAVGLRRSLETWRAVPDIGPKKMASLVEHGVRTVRRLAEMDFFHIERVLSRNPPFGQKIVRSLAHFPRLVLAVDIPKRDEGPENRIIVRAILGCSNREAPIWKERAPWVTLAAETSDGRLVFFWKGKVKSLMPSKDLVFTIEAAKGEQVFVWASCEEIAGTYVTGEVTV
ncbi:hypothetical protein CSAL01_06520 [Colletotrichum salicis]|uniref:SEC63 domain-containing protein n=1 Tax=Colletotrichum salicis TaxID=1209931 RepID=A0A135UD96_9PEZI|nr:hypothetical protein CSAL01_06520 [Colletotrichum salicis]